MGITRRITQMYAVLIGALGLVGLFVSGHLFNILNVDMNIDIARIGLLVLLAYAGFVSSSVRVAAYALLFVGIAYIVMGIWSVFDSSLGGLLPSGFTGFDLGFHLVTGVLAVLVGFSELAEDQELIGS